MAKMKRWTGTAWEVLDAKDADTVDGKHASDFATSNHTHDNRYYTEDEINSNFVSKSEFQKEFDSHKNNKVAHIDYAVASGTNTYTANIQGITKLVEGLSVKIKFQNANTGAATENPGRPGRDRAAHAAARPGR